MKTRWPEGFELTGKLMEYAAGKGIEEPEEEFEAFRDYCAANDRKYADWPAAWRNWVRNAVKWRKHGRAESFAERNIRTMFEGTDKLLSKVAASLPESTDAPSAPSLFGSALGPEPGSNGNGLRRRH